MTQDFPFDFEDRFRRLARLFGITPDNSSITVHDQQLAARFGRWHIRTPLANIASVELTGPYAFLKTAGPARLAITDRGLTFASNSRRGVLFTFHEPIAGIDPWGRLRHPNLTLTPADCDGLAAAAQPGAAAS